MPAPTLAPDARTALDLLRDIIEAAAGDADPVHPRPARADDEPRAAGPRPPGGFARIGRIVFMGGGAQMSNATAAAEFNVFHDPEAAAIVLDACAAFGVPGRRCTASTSSTTRWSPMPTSRALRALGTPVRTSPPGSSPSTTGGSPTRARRSATPAPSRCSSLPDALHTERRPVRVELSGTWTRGRTIVDTRDWSGDMDHDPHGLAPALVDVALEVDGPRSPALAAHRAGEA